MRCGLCGMIMSMFYWYWILVCLCGMGYKIIDMLQGYRVWGMMVLGLGILGILVSGIGYVGWECGVSGIEYSSYTIPH